MGGDHAKHGRIAYGDSLETLRALSEPVDVFINDSDHSADYEYQEYQVIAPLLSDRGIILGDNAHASETWRCIVRSGTRSAVASSAMMLRDAISRRRCGDNVGAVKAVSELIA